MSRQEYLLTKATSRAERAEAELEVLRMRVEDVMNAVDLQQDEKIAATWVVDLLLEVLD